MDSYEILKHIHKVGHPMPGEVLSCETEWIAANEKFSCRAVLKTESRFKAILSFETSDVKKIPSPGDLLNTIVYNHVEDTLYLKRYPEDINEILAYQEFYACIENDFKEGTIVTGKIARVEHFGVFVNLSCRFWGLIDIVNRGKPLPKDFKTTMKAGDDIRCVVAWFSFNNRQIRLHWLPLEE